jgi:rhodanese-related sulfurtransferase
MKTNILVSMILVLAMIPLSAALGQGVVKPHLPRITVEEVKTKVDRGDKDFVLLDIRDAATYEAGHIKGAVNIYYSPTGDPMSRQMMLMALPMDRLIVVYCDCLDDDSSAIVVDELLMLGYDKDKVRKYPMVTRR